MRGVAIVLFMVMTYTHMSIYVMCVVQHSYTESFDTHRFAGKANQVDEPWEVRRQSL